MAVPRLTFYGMQEPCNPRNNLPEIRRKIASNEAPYHSIRPALLVGVLRHVVIYRKGTIHWKLQYAILVGDGRLLESMSVSIGMFDDMARIVGT